MDHVCDADQSRIIARGISPKLIDRQTERGPERQYLWSRAAGWWCHDTHDLSQHDKNTTTASFTLAVLSSFFFFIYTMTTTTPPPPTTTTTTYDDPSSSLTFVNKISNIFMGLGDLRQGKLFGSHDNDTTSMDKPPGTTSLLLGRGLPTLTFQECMIEIISLKSFLYSPNVLWFLLALLTYPIVPYNLQESTRFQFQQRLIVNMGITLIYTTFWHCSLYWWNMGQRPFQANRHYKLNKVYERENICMDCCCCYLDSLMCVASLSLSLFSIGPSQYLLYNTRDSSMDCYRSGLSLLLSNSATTTAFFYNKYFIRYIDYTPSIHSLGCLSRCSFLFRSSIDPYELSLQIHSFRSSSQYRHWTLFWLEYASHRTFVLPLVSWNDTTTTTVEYIVPLVLDGLAYLHITRCESFRIWRSLQRRSTTLSTSSILWMQLWCRKLCLGCMVRNLSW